MSKKAISKKAVIGLSAAAAVILLGGVGIYASSQYGTASDPLITKSYVDSVLVPEVNDMISDASKDSYQVVTLSSGQILKGEPGCEILLRIGSASASGGDSPCLVDTTSGSSLENGKALTANHLYMITISGNGIKATASTTKVLVKGTYTIS